MWKSSQAKKLSSTFLYTHHRRPNSLCRRGARCLQTDKKDVRQPVGHQTILVEIWPQLRFSANLGSKLTKIFSWTMPQGERIWKIWKGLIWRFVLLISMHGSLARVKTTRRHKASCKTRNQRPITLTRGWFFLETSKCEQVREVVLRTPMLPCCPIVAPEKQVLHHGTGHSSSPATTCAIGHNVAHFLETHGDSPPLLIRRNSLKAHPFMSITSLLISTSRKHIGTHQSTTQGQVCQPWHSEFKVVGYTPLAVAKECTMTSLSESPSIGPSQPKNEKMKWLDTNCWSVSCENEKHEKHKMNPKKIFNARFH